MAIFLLIYVLFLIIWLVWSGVLIYHALKYRFPHDESTVYLVIFIGLSAVILFVSFLVISQADWLTVPKIFGEK